MVWCFLICLVVILCRLDILLFIVMIIIVVIIRLGCICRMRWFGIVGMWMFLFVMIVLFFSRLVIFRGF